MVVPVKKLPRRENVFRFDPGKRKRGYSNLGVRGIPKDETNEAKREILDRGARDPKIHILQVHQGGVQFRIPPSPAPRYFMVIRGAANHANIYPSRQVQEGFLTDQSWKERKSRDPDVFVIKKDGEAIFEMEPGVFSIVVGVAIKPREWSEPV